MPPSAKVISELERIRSPQRCYERPQCTSSGHGEYCPYDGRWQQFLDCQMLDTAQSQSTVHRNAQCFATVLKRRPSNPHDLLDDAERGLIEGSSDEVSVGTSSFLQDSSLSLSGSSATLATSVCSSAMGSELEPQVKSERAVNHRDQYDLLRQDLEECRQRLRRTIQTCNRAEYHQVRCAISCVFGSARPLSRPELAAAVKLNTLGRDWRSVMHDEQWARLEQWMHKCNSIFVETLNGKIDFHHPKATRVFLRSRRIPGIDVGHRTFGMISRNHVQLQRFLAGDLTARSDLVQAVDALSSYIGEFGNHHLRAASLTSIIEIEENDSCDDVGDDFEMISEGTNQLSLVDKGRDWVVVKQSRV